MKTLPEMMVYEHETVPVYQCHCRWVFALRSDPVHLPRIL